jgi:antitoxin component YwqK of YwqJK toxin-antitoxin module
MNFKFYLLALATIFGMTCYSQVVSCDKLEDRDGVMYLKGESNPYTGKCETNNSNKIKILETDYKNGKANGKETVWDGKGNKYSETSFIEGKFNGIYRQWFDNGQLEIEKMYLNDKMNGKCTHYYRNGKKESEGIYNNCYETGTWTYWDEQGNKTTKNFKL